MKGHDKLPMFWSVADTNDNFIRFNEDIDCNAELKFIDHQCEGEITIILRIDMKNTIPQLDNIQEAKVKTTIAKGDSVIELIKLIKYQIMGQLRITIFSNESMQIDDQFENKIYELLTSNEFFNNPREDLIIKETHIERDQVLEIDTSIEKLSWEFYQNLLKEQKETEQEKRDQ